MHLKRPIIPITALAFSALVALIPAVQAGSRNAVTPSSKEILISSSDNEARLGSNAALAAASMEAAASALYEKLGLEAMGLSKKAMNYAYKGFEYLRNRGELATNVLTIVDFSQSSRQKRMYIIDMDREKVLLNTYVAHGKNSGLDYATKFSNTMSSLQSSLGFYVTKNTYFGKHGLSLRLDGMEKGFNDRAMDRAIVVHGANYIGAHRKNSSYNGRSFGCPAVPQTQAKTVINMIKEGTALFIYHPSNSYLHGSSILNG